MARKMPPHIVLPNGMWRFVKRGSAGARKTRSSSAGSVGMARRRRSGGFRARRARGSGSGGLMALVKPIAAGAAGSFANRYLPQVVPMQNLASGAAAAYLFAGKSLKSAALGAAGAYGMNTMVPGGTGSPGSLY